MMEQIKGEIEAARKEVVEAEAQRQEVMNETAKRREVEKRWVDHYRELEEERNRVKKEIEDYYDVDRAGYD